MVNPRIMNTEITLGALRDLLKRNRTYRRFDASAPIERSTLVSFVELVRYTASGRNAQPLRYSIVDDKELCDKIFPALKWAGYYTDWDGPAISERPVAYLVQSLDTRLGANCLCDDGLQLEAITLGAASCGIGNCIIKSFNAQTVSEVLELPEYLKPRYVVALGYPAENVVIEDMSGEADADFKYYRTPDGTHHVPKRPLQELLTNQLT